MAACRKGHGEPLGMRWDSRKAKGFGIGLQNSTVLPNGSCQRSLPGSRISGKAIVMRIAWPAELFRFPIPEPPPRSGRCWSARMRWFKDSHFLNCLEG